MRSPIVYIYFSSFCSSSSPHKWKTKTATLIVDGPPPRPPLAMTHPKNATFFPKIQIATHHCMSFSIITGHRRTHQPSLTQPLSPPSTSWNPHHHNMKPAALHRETHLKPTRYLPLVWWKEKKMIEGLIDGKWDVWMFGREDFRGKEKIKRILNRHLDLFLSPSKLGWFIKSIGS